MIEKLAFLGPEIAVFLTTCLVMVVGVSPKLEIRRLCAPLSMLGLFVAAVLAINGPIDEDALVGGMHRYAKALTALLGILLLMLLPGAVDREYEASVAAGETKYDPIRANRAEFYALSLFSITGVMLCASATDLVWLFLALELVSLPTYVMVTLSTRGTASQEAGVKYFFLGALGAAIFLYGFALLYGATGTTSLIGIRDALATQALSEAGLNPMAVAGMLLALAGVSFKIAAVPMHFYTADVYQGAAASVSALLAVLPKIAGFITIFSLIAAVGWDYRLDPATGAQMYEPGAGSLPLELSIPLTVIAILTMTVGNVLAVLQTSVKRMMAYSSIAHTGYMLVGLIAGPAVAESMGVEGVNGLSALLFYLLAYSLSTIGVFAVISMIERRRGTPGGVDRGGDEIDTFQSLRGICRSRRSAALGWTLVICGLGLVGLPPLLGFFGKYALITSAISAELYLLVGALAINSAIAAFYYLRLVAAPLLEDPSGEPPDIAPVPSRTVSGVICASLTVIMILPIGITDVLLDAARGGAGPLRIATPSDPEQRRYMEHDHNDGDDADGAGEGSGRSTPSDVSRAAGPIADPS